MAEEAGDIVYLDVDDALFAFATQLALSVEEARDQLTALGKLDSALHRPRAHAHYETDDLAVLAVVLAEGIMQAHAFIDGNKRTANLAMASFLAANGYGLDLSYEDEAIDLPALMIDLLEHKITIDRFADWLRGRLTPVSTE